MGFGFRKSFKIAPGVRLNVGKKGVSSVSIGGKGARVNVGKKGTRTTLSAPGTGLSYSTFKSHSKQKTDSGSEQPSSSLVANIVAVLIVIFFLIWLFN